MNIFYADDGSFYDIVYDGECKRRFVKKNGLKLSFILAKKIGFWWKTSLPVMALFSISLSDQEDEYEYAHAKFMFVPNPAFFLPYFSFISFFCFMWFFYAYEHPEMFLIILPKIGIDLIVSLRMIKRFREYIAQGFYSSSGVQAIPCSFWRAGAIYFLSLFAFFGAAIAVMQGTDPVKVEHPNSRE